MPAVNPALLIWARETAGLSLEEASKAIGLGAARGQTGAQRLADIESGLVEPSDIQLSRMSEKYRRSLIVFYLDNPPRRGNRGRDFRSLPDTNNGELEPQLDALLRNIQARHGLVLSLLEDEEAQPLAFIGSANQTVDEDELAQEIVSTLEFDIEVFRAQSDASHAFNYLRSRVEDVGIFVLLVGDLGSHQSDIGVDTFRGFAIADRLAPFIVINDNDISPAWSFTVFHELAHLWLGESGISGRLQAQQIAIERYCNEVAGRILIPAYDLDQFARVGRVPIDEALAQIYAASRAFNVSQSMVAYRLYKANFISKSRWDVIQNRLAAYKVKPRAKDEQETQSKGGPSYYVVRRHRLGHAVLDLVDRALNEGNISPTKAGMILGVQPRNIAPLLDFQERR